MYDFFEIEHIKGKEYIKITNLIANNCNSALLTYLDNSPNIFGKISPIPTELDLKNALLSDIEKINYYTLSYYNIIDILTRYSSFKELLYINDIYRIIFIKNKTAIIEVMADGIYLYV